MRTLLLLFLTGIVLSTNQYDEPIVSADDTSITHDSTLPCGQCILGGYIFCMQSKDERAIQSTDAAPPSAACCETEADCSTQIADTSFSCSSQYTDQDYAMHMCPFKTQKCDQSGDVMEKESADTAASVNPTGMSAGDVCFYKMKNACDGGVVGLKSSEGTYVSVLEFAEDDVDVTKDPAADDSAAPDSTEAKTSPPEGDMPPRNERFSAESAEGEEEGAKKQEMRKPPQANQGEDSQENTHSFGNEEEG